MYKLHFLIWKWVMNGSFLYLYLALMLFLFKLYSSIISLLTLCIIIMVFKGVASKQKKQIIMLSMFSLIMLKTYFKFKLHIFYQFIFIPSKLCKWSMEVNSVWYCMQKYYILHICHGCNYSHNQPWSIFFKIFVWYAKSILKIVNICK